jgi:hypothetical protein
MAIKLNSFIDLISTAPIKDAEGFVTHGDTVLSSARAYFEPKNSTEKWANMAAFSTINALFRFRKILCFEVNPTLCIVSDSGRYRVVSVEVIAEKIEGSEK